MNHHNPTSQYNIFLSSITYCIRRVTSILSVLLVHEVVRNVSKSSLHFMPAEHLLYRGAKTPPSGLYMYVCTYVCVRTRKHTHTHTRHL